MKRKEIKDVERTEDAREVILTPDQLNELFRRLDKSITPAIKHWVTMWLEDNVPDKLNDMLKENAKDSIKLELIKKMVG